MYRKIFVAFLGLCLIFIENAHASVDKLAFYHDFWRPSYHGEHLNYCLYHKPTCGIEVANKYCKIMGYEKATKAFIANNVGLANYIDGCPNCKKTQCKGWNCNGFKVIRCADKIKHTPIYVYHFRKRDFVVPRLAHFRLDWCYEDGNGCGKKAANSFCRMMGYMQAINYNLDSNVYASREIGNGKLCFGKSCRGFSKITCYR